MENILTAVDGYKVAKIDESNIEQVFNLCKQNKQYYEYLQESPTLQNVKNILNELPPNTTINQKYFVGFYNKTELIAILDLIDSYPKNKSVFIGLFMVDTKYQGIGVGQHIIKTLLHNLKSKNFLNCSLGVIDKNTNALSFWLKMGFQKTNQIYNHKQYNVIMLNYNFQ